MTRQTGPRPNDLSQLVWLAVLAMSLLLSACASPGDGPGAANGITLPTLVPTFTSVVVVDNPSPEPETSVTPTWMATPTAAPTVTRTATPSITPTPGCQERGQIVSGRFPSTLARPDLAYRIYLPPCYGHDNRVYPVLYMLPGNIHDDSIWDQLGLDEAAESGIESETLPPMLIVMPEGGAISNQTSGGPYSYESVIVDELRPHIEANYCAWQEAAGRAIGGLSRGGYWSLEIAFRNPALYSSVGGHGAALVDTYAGPTLDPKYTASTSDLSSLRVYLDAGNSDWYLGQLQVLHNNLLAAGKDHSWVIQEGGHNNDYWSAHVSDYLAWYAEPWLTDRDALPICDARPAG